MADAPRRIQRKRTKGWKMPADAVYVGRPSMWGNPYKFRKYVLSSQMSEDARLALRGKDLACWCPLGEPCHADVLLEIANAE